MSGGVRCPECGSRMRKDGDKYYCKECDEFFDMNELVDIGIESDYDSTPDGCEGCGGPYPLCVGSCPAFDD